MVTLIGGVVSRKQTGCKVCSGLDETSCKSILKEVIQLSEPRGRLQMLGDILDSSICERINESACIGITDKALEDIGWDTVLSHLFDECQSGNVVLSHPKVMKFNSEAAVLTAFHAQASSTVSQALHGFTAEHLSAGWRVDCQSCEGVGVEDDLACMQRLYAGVFTMETSKRLSFYHSVFSTDLCTELGLTDSACLAVMDAKLMRSGKSERKTVLMRGCAQGAFPTLANAKPVDAELLAPQCQACVIGEGAAMCSRRLSVGVAGLPPQQRLSTYATGLLSSSTMQRCEGMSSGDCLSAVDHHFAAVPHPSPQLLSHCVAGSLPSDALTLALAADVSKGVHGTHSVETNAAMGDWAAAESQGSKKHMTGATEGECTVCTGLSDKACLAALQALEDALTNLERLDLLDYLIPDQEECADDTSDVFACYKVLYLASKGWDDQTALALLTEGCAAGYLTPSDTVVTEDTDTGDEKPDESEMTQPPHPQPPNGKHRTLFYSRGSDPPPPPPEGPPSDPPSGTSEPPAEPMKVSKQSAPGPAGPTPPPHEGLEAQLDSKSLANSKSMPSFEDPSTPPGPPEPLKPDPAAPPKDFQPAKGNMPSFDDPETLPPPPIPTEASSGTQPPAPPSDHEPGTHSPDSENGPPEAVAAVANTAGQESTKPMRGSIAEAWSLLQATKNAPPASQFTARAPEKLSGPTSSNLYVTASFFGVALTALLVGTVVGKVVKSRREAARRASYFYSSLP